MLRLYHIETSQLVCHGNTQTGFYMMGTITLHGLNMIYEFSLCQSLLITETLLGGVSR